MINEEALNGIEENRTLVNTIIKGKRDWIGHVRRKRKLRIMFLKHIGKEKEKA